MAAPNRKDARSPRNFPTIPNRTFWARGSATEPRWWNIEIDQCMMGRIDENGDYNFDLDLDGAMTTELASLRLRAKPKRLMFQKYNRTLIPSIDLVNNDILWEIQGLNYLKYRIFFAEENASPAWKKFDIKIANWEQCISQWRRLGKSIRQFGFLCGSDQYEEYFIDEVEQNHERRIEIYEQIENLEEKKETLTGKENKKKRNSINKKIKELRKNARSIPFAPKITLNKAAPDFEIRKKLFVNKEKDKYFRYCSWCEKGMSIWGGCPCKTVWYCNEKCQRRHWKKGGHKEVCPFKN